MTGGEEKNKIQVPTEDLYDDVIVKRRLVLFLISFISVQMKPVELDTSHDTLALLGVLVASSFCY